VISTSHHDPTDLKSRVASLRARGRINYVQAVCYLHRKHLVLLPDGFRHISESEYADSIAEVEEALREEAEEHSREEDHSR